MKKKKIIMSTVLVAAIAIVIGLACVWGHLSDYSNTLNANWGFELPSKSHYKEIYSNDSGASFHGDGIRYHIFSYKEAEPIREMLDWSREEGETIFHYSYEEATAQWLSRIEVPAEKLPDYSQCQYWYASRRDNSEILMMWDASKNRVYIAESFL